MVEQVGLDGAWGVSVDKDVLLLEAGGEFLDTQVRREGTQRIAIRHGGTNRGNE